MKRSLFLALLSLLLLLSACAPPSTSKPEISSTPPASKPEISSTPPASKLEISSTPPTQAPTEVTLSDRFLMVQDVSSFHGINFVALWDGQVVGRGRLAEVINFATGETVGFTKTTLLVRPEADGSMEYYDFYQCPREVDLYHLDGSPWMACGSFDVYGVLGDYFIGYDTDSGFDFLRYYTKDPTDCATWHPAPCFRQAGENLCLIENDAKSDFLGITGFALVDNKLNILAKMDRPRDDYDLEVAEIGQPYCKFYLKSEQYKHLIDMSTLKETPYCSMRELNYGYRVFERDDGHYDILDWEDKLIRSDCARYIKECNGNLTIEEEYQGSSDTGTEDAELHEAVTTTYVYRGDRFWRKFEQISKWNSEAAYYIEYEPGRFMMNPDRNSDKAYREENGFTTTLIGDSLYVTDLDGKEITRYNAQLKKCKTFSGTNLSSASGAVRYRSSEGNWLIPIGYTQAVRIADESSVTCLTSEKYIQQSLEDVRYAVQSDWEHPSYTLLDSRGAVIRSSYQYLSSSNYPGIYLALTGVRWGIIDKDGNWLWSEYAYEE